MIIVTDGQGPVRRPQHQRPAPGAEQHEASGKPAACDRHPRHRIGNKGLGFMQRMGAKVVSHVTHLGDTPHLDKLIGPIKVMIDAFQNGELDAVYLGYTKFINTMKQEPVLEQLLPLTGERWARRAHWDYLYEPDAQVVIDELLVRYVEALIYQGVAENMASEQSRADGGHEGGHRQRGQRHQGTAAGLQQGPPGGDHQGNFRNCRRRCGHLRVNDLI
jgi:hypothetical protein